MAGQSDHQMKETGPLKMETRVQCGTRCWLLSDVASSYLFVLMTSFSFPMKPINMLIVFFERGDVYRR